MQDKTNKQTNLTTAINIMTSCDQNLIEYIPVQLKTLSLSVDKSKLVDFYIFYTDIDESKLLQLSNYTSYFENITLKPIYIEDVSEYRQLAVKGGRWGAEAYFSLLCHKYLPQSVDRILYVDAGDVIFNGDFDEYYNCNFNGQALMVTPSRFKSDGGIFGPYDLDVYDNILEIKRGVFNSGSYMINVDCLRKNKIEMSQYLEISETIAEMIPDEELKYFGDQGFLSLVFLESIIYFDYPKTRNLWYMPYNFCLWFFDRGLELFGSLWYEPKIIHFAGAKKPWNVSIDNMDELKDGQAPYYEQWHRIKKEVERELASI